MWMRRQTSAMSRTPSLSAKFFPRHTLEPRPNNRLSNGNVCTSPLLSNLCGREGHVSATPRGHWIQVPTSWGFSELTVLGNPFNHDEKKTKDLVCGIYSAAIREGGRSVTDLCWLLELSLSGSFAAAWPFHFHQFSELQCLKRKPSDHSKLGLRHNQESS